MVRPLRIDVLEIAGEQIGDGVAAWLGIAAGPWIIRDRTGLSGILVDRGQRRAIGRCRRFVELRYGDGDRSTCRQGRSRSGTVVAKVTEDDRNRLAGVRVVAGRIAQSTQRPCHLRQAALDRDGTGIVSGDAGASACRHMDHAVGIAQRDLHLALACAAALVARRLHVRERESRAAEIDDRGLGRRKGSVGDGQGGWVVDRSYRGVDCKRVGAVAVLC